MGKNPNERKKGSILCIHKGENLEQRPVWESNNIVEVMGHLSSMFNCLARLFLMKKGRSSGRCDGREAAEAMAKEARKNDLTLCSLRTVNVDGSNNFTEEHHILYYWDLSYNNFTKSSATSCQLWDLNLSSSHSSSAITSTYLVQENPSASVEIL